MSWPKVKLGDCCEIVSGATPRTGNSDYWGGEIPWVSPKSLSKLESKYLEEPTEYITQLGFDSCSTRMLPPMSLLLSCRAPVGLTAINREPICTNQGFKSLIPNPEMVDINYLFHVMRRMRPMLESQGRGTTFKEVSKAIVSRFEIPLPPLNEQKRIAAILDMALSLNSKSSAINNLRESFQQSLLVQMFSEKLVSIKSLPGYTELSSVSRKTKSLDPRVHPDLEFDLYSIPAYDVGECQKSLGKEIGSSKKILETDDVVISRLVPHIRRVWIIPPGDDNVKLGSSEWIVFSSTKFHPVFFRAVLLSEEFHQHFMNSVAGVGGSLVRARPSVVLKLNVLCPPLSDQIAFAKIIEKFQKLPDISLDTIHNFKSIEQEIFA